ncbi:MAG: hypothetical protein ACKVT2_22055 [Saprospiraceae bacterium]
MDKLSKLQHRKVALEAKIEQQRADLKNTFVELRAELEPGKLLQKAVRGFFGFLKKKPGDEASKSYGQLPAPLAFAVDLLVRDPKWALGLKLLAPIAIKLWAKNESSKALNAENSSDTNEDKHVKIYARLRQGVSALRKRIRKAENPAETDIQKTDQ